MRSLFALGLVCLASTASAVKWTEVSFPEGCSAKCDKPSAAEDIAKLTSDCFAKISDDDKSKCTSATVTFVPDAAPTASECKSAKRRLTAIDADADAARLSVSLKDFLGEITALSDLSPSGMKLAALDAKMTPSDKCDKAVLFTVKDEDACTSTDGTQSSVDAADKTTKFEKLNADLTDMEAVTIVLKAATAGTACTVTADDGATPEVSVTADVTVPNGDSPAPTPSSGVTVTDPKVTFKEKKCKAPDACAKLTSTDDVEKCLAAAAKDKQCKTATYTRSYTGLTVGTCAESKPSSLRRLEDIPEMSKTAPRLSLNLTDVIEDAKKVTSGTGVASVTEVSTGQKGASDCDAAALFSVAKDACTATKGTALALKSEKLEPIDFKGDAVALDDKATALVISVTPKKDKTCTVEAADPSDVSLAMSTDYTLGDSKPTTTTPKPSGALNQVAAAGLVTLAAVTLF